MHIALNRNQLPKLYLLVNVYISVTSLTTTTYV